MIASKRLGLLLSGSSQRFINAPVIGFGKTIFIYGPGIQEGMVAMV